MALKKHTKAKKHTYRPFRKPTSRALISLRKEHGLPNLDGMSEGELMAFWKRYHRPTRKDAKSLVGDTRKGYVSIAQLSSGYASNKAAAMYCRKRGDISGASIYESICDRIYQKLPDDLKW